MQCLGAQALEGKRLDHAVMALLNQLALAVRGQAGPAFFLLPSLLGRRCKGSKSLGISSGRCCGLAGCGIAMAACSGIALSAEGAGGVWMSSRLSAVRPSQGSAMPAAAGGRTSASGAASAGPVACGCSGLSTARGCWIGGCGIAVTGEGTDGVEGAEGVTAAANAALAGAGTAAPGEAGASKGARRHGGQGVGADADARAQCQGHFLARAHGLVCHPDGITLAQVRNKGSSESSLTMACTRATEASGSEMMSLFWPLRPIVPPAMPNTACQWRSTATPSWSTTLSSILSMES